MKKFVPYVNMETVKDSNGNIERFEVRTITYLPKDSKITTSGEGTVADNVYYRPLTITYNGTSEDFDYFSADFTIQREDIGLLERGVNVKVKSMTLSSDSISLRSASQTMNDEGSTGVSVDYEEGDV